MAMIYQAHVSFIIELCTGSCALAQIIAWIQAIIPENYIQGIENYEFYVAEDARRYISGLLIFNSKFFPINQTLVYGPGEYYIQVEK